MTEEEALERLSEIGQAFANDLHDGDDNVNYEGADVTWRGGHSFLTYSAELEDGTKVEYRWLLLPVTPESEKEILGEG